MDAEEERIGDRIKRARNSLKLTQDQLADAIGADRTSVIDWEKHRTFPGNYLAPLARTLNVTTDWLIFGQSPRPVSIPGAPSDVRDALESGDWRKIALALATTQAEYATATRIQAEAQKLAQENIGRAFDEAGAGPLTPGGEREDAASAERETALAGGA